MTVVRFRVGWRAYNAGESADFPAALAARLVADGVAAEVGPAPAAPVVTAPSSPPVATAMGEPPKGRRRRPQG